jgi:hypothetical protein
MGHAMWGTRLGERDGGDGNRLTEKDEHNTSYDWLHNVSSTIDLANLPRGGWFECVLNIIDYQSYLPDRLNQARKLYLTPTRR